MLHNLSSLLSFTIGATDGEIGKVDQFYFDDHTWNIRYFIVKTGGWLSGRKVLLSPHALLTPDWEGEVFPVNLNRKQIEDSPDTNTETTVSRQHEIELYKHYAWPYYPLDGAGFYGGMGMSGMMDSRVPLEDIIAEQHMEKQNVDSHLRSTAEVKGYHIHATDGNIGEVEDFIVNDQDWHIDYLVVDTGKWFPGRKVVLSTDWISQVRWEDSSVYVDMSVNKIKSSPEYNQSEPLTNSFIEKLHHHYGKSFRER